MNFFSPLALTSKEFVDFLVGHGGKGKTHALSMYKNFHRKGVLALDSNLLPNSSVLMNQFQSMIDCKLPCLERSVQEAGTIKFLMKTEDGYCVEAVIIAMKGRNTLCVSSQIGCDVGCVFCKTGTVGCIRNLSVQEIVSQLFIARHFLQKEIHNIVFMGMGEPFLNYDAVVQAAQIFADPFGGGIGERKITVATSGELDKIVAFAHEKRICPNLAISINAPTDSLRGHLMPKRRKVSLASLRDCMETYCALKGREIFVTYVLLNGINDSPQMANALCEFLCGLPVRINVIPYNSHPTSMFSPPPIDSIRNFVKTLRERGYAVFLRGQKGETIQAACGQLVASY